MTEQQGPFFIERNGNIVLIRSKQPFRWQITLHRSAKQQGAMYTTEAIALSGDMQMILSTVGSDDVVIEGK